MNNVIGKLAILFAGFIVAGAFLNVYMVAAAFLLLPTLRKFGIQGDVGSPLYWFCLAAGVVTAFLVMRPAWRMADQPLRRKTTAPTQDEERSSTNQP